MFIFKMIHPTLSVIFCKPPIHLFHTSIYWQIFRNIKKMCSTSKKVIYAKFLIPFVAISYFTLLTFFVDCGAKWEWSRSISQVGSPLRPRKPQHLNVKNGLRGADRQRGARFLHKSRNKHKKERKKVVKLFSASFVIAAQRLPRAHATRINNIYQQQEQKTPPASDIMIINCHARPLSCSAVAFQIKFVIKLLLLSARAICIFLSP